jgi:plastocyanin
MIRGPRATGIVGLLLALAWLGAACTGSPGVAGTSPGASATSGAGHNGYGGGTQGGTVSGSPSQIQVQVQQGVGGLIFSPSKLSVKRGTQIIVTDPGSFQHTFTIPGQGIDIVNDPGQFQTVAITIPPGTYTFVCRFHQAQGMRGTLTVTP